MLNRYDQLWHSLKKPGKLRPAIGMSALLHIGLVLAALYYGLHKEIPVTKAAVFAVELSPEMAQSAESMAAPIPEPKPEPIPEPPKPEPKPEPPPPEIKPDPVPEPEPPAPEPEPKPMPKPEPPKEKPKPEPKPEPPKEKPKPEPKPEPPKEEPKPEPKPEPPKEIPKPEPVPELPPKPAPPAPPSKSEVRMQQALPGPLAAWGRLIQIKVEKTWRLPGGVRIDPSDNEAVVSFWVSKTGQIIGTPEIVKNAADPMVGRSAVEAVREAAPFPPLPDNYADTEAHVIYTFVPAG